MKTPKRLRFSLLTTLFVLATFLIPHLTLASTDLNQNEIPDHEEDEVIVSTHQTLEAGEYTFNNLIIDGATLTLEGDMNSEEEFKGVKINAQNLTIKPFSKIEAENQGFNKTGPGYGANSQIGSSHGGIGGGNTSDTVYGSPTEPKTLGTGNSSRKGGGAIWLNVSDTLNLEGDISASTSTQKASGGSVFIQTSTITGTGNIRANGGNAESGREHAGAGGRIAVHYDTNTFSGLTQAKAGQRCTGSCVPGAEDGTTIFINQSTNTLELTNNFTFQNLSYAFSNINISNGATVTVPGTLNLTNLTIQPGSKLIFESGSTLTASTLEVSGTLVLLNTDQDITNTEVNPSGVITTEEEHPLLLKTQNLTIHPGGSVNADSKGHCQGKGPGLAEVGSFAGASYGGTGGGNTNPAYGSETEPTDFGSAGRGYNPCGGGALKIESTDITNNGSISANGDNTSSGGSVFIETTTITGTGDITSNGGENYCPGVQCHNSGAGGRIAIYFKEHTLSGDITANSGKCAPLCEHESESGTVYLKDVDALDPVIIIPGITGTYLYQNRDPFDEVWINLLKLALPGEDRYLNELMLDINGREYQDRPMVVGDIIRSAAGVEVYSGLIEDMLDNGYAEGENLFVFPYDWRFSNEHSAQLLDEKIKQVLTQTGSDNVDIVAHSMGGLVSKQYLFTEGSDVVDQVVFVGTPHLGAPKTFKALMYGDDMGYKFFLLGLSRSRMRHISQNMPAVFELLPSQTYFNKVGGYVVDGTDSSNEVLMSYAEVQDYMISEGRNELMFPFAEKLHENIDDLDLSEVDVHNFVGCGEKTIGQIVLRKKLSWVGLGLLEVDDYDIRYTNSDGTVPIYSAEAVSYGTKYIVKGSTHGKLPSADGVRESIVSILTGQDLPSSPHILPNTDGCKFSGKIVSTHSPVEMHIYDEAGNHAGPDENGDIELNIPGVVFDEIGEENFAFLPDGANYKVVKIATDTGGYNFKIEDVDEDDNITNVYNWTLIPLSTLETSGEIWVGPDYADGEYAVQIDSDGDGAFDDSYESGFDGTEDAKIATSPKEEKVEEEETTIEQDNDSANSVGAPNVAGSVPVSFLVNTQQDLVEALSQDETQESASEAVVENTEPEEVAPVEELRVSNELAYEDSEEIQLPEIVKEVKEVVVEHKTEPEIEEIEVEDKVEISEQDPASDLEALELAASVEDSGFDINPIFIFAASLALLIFGLVKKFGKL